MSKVDSCKKKSKPNGALRDEEKKKNVFLTMGGLSSADWGLVYFYLKNLKIFKILRHIKSLNVCIEY